MESIIKKAIEGGYETDDYDLAVLKDLKKHHAWLPIETQSRFVCDPLFWQSLGKACGWRPDEDRYNGRWYGIATAFYQINLTEGWDSAVKYLSDLIK